MEDKVIRVTPCCKSRHWQPALREDIPEGVVRCRICDKLHDFESLHLVVDGYNPLTHMCDKCKKKMLEEVVKDE